MRIQERTISYEDFLEEPKRPYILGYEEKENVILHYREDGIKFAMRITDYPWYFCVEEAALQEQPKLFDELLEFQKIKKIEKEKNGFVRIYVRNVNRKVMDEKHEVLNLLDEKKIRTYEADVNSSQRCLIDHQLKLEENYRVLYFDIETDDRGKGIMIGRDRILSIACMNQEGKVYYYTGEDERKLLKKFLDRIEDYDLITGWNSEKFDVPYIRERLRYHDIWYNWRQILHVDMMQKMMEVHRKNADLIREVRGFSLDAISKHFLGESKIEHEMGIYEMFEKAPDQLKKYNIQDTALLKKLDDKLKLIRQKVVEHTITGCFLNEYAVSRILDVYILRNAKGKRFPSKPKRDSLDFDPNKESGYVGGYVIEPKRGVHENVHHFDFTSLYPSIIQTFNISPETWRFSAKGERVSLSYADIYTPNEQVFESKQGIIPKLLTDLLTARNDIRHKEIKKYKEGTVEYETLYYKQYAFKTIANSFYGILGAPFTRYYKIETAEAITLSGHYLVKLIRSWFESNGYSVLYGDTDSVFVSGDFDPTGVSKEINMFIEYHLHKHFNVTNSKIDLKVEATYPSVLFVDKKRYVKNEDGKLKIVGLEARRRETLPLAAKAQVELFHDLLIHKLSPTELIEKIEKLKNKIAKGMSKEELTLQIKLSKDVDLYDKKVKDEFGEVTEVKESKLAHVKVAKWLREQGIKEKGMNSWEKGCYIRYVVIDHKPKIEAISVYQFNGKYDAAYYWNVKVYAILQRILEVVYPEYAWDQHLIEVPKKPRKKRNTKQQALL